MTVDQTVLTPPVQGDETSASVNTDYSTLLASITNQDGTQKYSDIEAALSSLSHTQDHIQRLEQENRDYKDNATSSQELYDMLNQGRDQEQSPEATPPQNVTADDVVAIINQLKTNDLKLSNKDKVLGQLSEVFGSPEKALEEYTKKAQELNVSTEFLDSISQSSPAAALAYFSKQESNLGPQPTGTDTDVRLDPATLTNKAPEKSLLSGATTNEIVDYWKQCAPAAT